MTIYTVTVVHAYDSPFEYIPRTASFAHRETAEYYIRQLTDLFKKADCERFCISLDSGELDSVEYLDAFARELDTKLTEDDLKEIDGW